MAITNFRSTIWGRLKDLGSAKVVWLCGTTAAVNGTTGKDIAGPGSLYTDIVGKTIRMNTGTIQNPTWGVLAADPASEPTQTTLKQAVAKEVVKEAIKK